MKKNKSLIFQFITWKIFLTLSALLAVFWLPLGCGLTNLSGTDFFTNFARMWSNFDGVHYLTIANYGYEIVGKTNLLFAFFPVYPWLVKTLNYLVNDMVVSGLLVSNLAFFASLFFLYKLFLLDYKNKIARLALLLILIFPTSFFFGSVYTEGVFFLLSVLTYYSARKNQFFLACLFAALASATRVTGIFLWPALVIEFYLIHGKKLKESLKPELIWLALPPLGLLSFMRFQYLKTGSTLSFISSQAIIGTSRFVDKMILPHQIFYRYIKMIFFMDRGDPLFFTILLEFLCGLAILTLLVAGLKKIRPSYWLYIFLSFLLPTLTGTFSGLPRYTVALFPLFGYFASILDKTHPYLRYFYYAISVGFSILAVSFFTRGYFVG